jgi:diguanylate cyclase (GGDEF)-like protein
MKLAALLLLANLGLLLHLGAGDLKPTAIWNWSDMVGEGGSALMVLVWIALLLKGRPAGRVTGLLFWGLGCLFLALWMDTVDEFVALPESVTWDHWLESVPMPIGFGLITLGIYHWHREQLAISAQMEKRERVFREHRLFDTVTPLGGADYLKVQLAQALKEGREQAQSFSLLILDLDDFQRLNRTWGHAEGDRVLQTLTQLLLLNLRRQDLLCRLAGDRFVVLLPNTGERQAWEFASELQLAVSSCAYRSSQGERLQLSAGVAAVMARNETPEQLLERLNLTLARSRRPLRACAT